MNSTSSHAFTRPILLLPHPAYFILRSSWWTIPFSIPTLMVQMGFEPLVGWFKGFRAERSKIVLRYSYKVSLKYPTLAVLMYLTLQPTQVDFSRVKLLHVRCLSACKATFLGSYLITVTYFGLTFLISLKIGPLRYINIFTTFSPHICVKDIFIFDE